MIKANEIRIGNWFMSAKADVPFQWQASDFEEINNTQAKPIPLTPEILEKAGFDKEFTESDVGVTVEETRNMRRYGGKRTYFTGWGNGKAHISPDFNCCYSIKLKYVHQVQNLYFALTGEELEIKL